MTSYGNIIWIPIMCKTITMILLFAFAIPIQAQEPTQEPTEQELENTQKLTTPLIPPAKAVEMIHLPDGFKATLFAGEPEVRQPIAVTTDTRGRIWIAECYTYAESKKNYDTQYNDRILIFEDTDGDGVADNRKVFWEGGKRLTSLEVGHGGVWVTCAPDFMFIPDRDGDDVPDGKPEVLLDGFNSDFIRHNMVNGLRWGPNGWLYGRHGIQATSQVGPPGTTESQRIAMNCSIWRFHPRTQEFEVICEGTTNPWGHDWDEHGELFIVNSVIGHLWHVVPGVRFRRMYGSHFNPYTYEVVEQTADHFHFSGKENWSSVKKVGISDETDKLGGGHAHCGAMIYLGDNWPQEYRGDLFTANFHGRRLNRESLEREGNSYVGKMKDDFMTTDDLWFRGVDLFYGPDGAVFLLDWSDIGECHENDGIHRTSGRIYKIAFGETKQVDANLKSKTTAELFELLDHPNRWFPRKASRLLQERALADDTSKDEIMKSIDARIESPKSAATDPNHLLQSIWLRHAINYGTDSPETLGKQLESLSKHANEHVRSWAVRMATDQPTEQLDPAIMKELLGMIVDEKSPLVRLYLASAMRNMSGLQRLIMANSLTRDTTDADDRVQPKLIWYNFEPAVVEHWAPSISLAKATKHPHLRRCIIRRLTAEIDVHAEFADAILAWSAEDNAPTQEILTAINDSLAGRRNVPTPKSWDDVSKKLNDRGDEQLKKSLAFLGAVFGEGDSVEQLYKIAKDKNLDMVVRRQAIKTLGESKPDDLFGQLSGLIWDRAVAVQVVRSFANCSQPEVADTILQRFGAFDPETEQGALATLCTRKPWSKKLLEYVANGKIDKRKITAAHARQIQLHADPELADLLTRHWGTIRESSADRLALMDRIRKQLEEKQLTVDLDNGARLFKTNCANCHVMFGEGGMRGPDLTGSDRKNVEYLLENMIDPSATVADTYRSSVLQMEDGRTLVGIVTEETPSTLKLLMAEEELVLETKSIEARKETEKSLMPDGLLDKLTEQEIADLFGYLQK
jgi:putative membrane-bound dehydrogenase-like protein